MDWYYDMQRSRVTLEMAQPNSVTFSVRRLRSHDRMQVLYRGEGLPSYPLSSLFPARCLHRSSHGVL